jgi:hypothetical protein
LYNSKRSADRYGMQFASSKCKIFLHDWVVVDPIVTIGGQHLEIVNEFTYFGSSVSADGSD